MDLNNKKIINPPSSPRDKLPKFPHTDKLKVSKSAPKYR